MSTATATTGITATMAITETMAEALRTRIREILTSREAQQTLIREPIIQMPATTEIMVTAIPEITEMEKVITEITETMAMARRV